nr:MAG TPA_asm: hypothetical protein [Caudoviricetes sp.]
MTSLNEQKQWTKKISKQPMTGIVLTLLQHCTNEVGLFAVYLSITVTKHLRP